MMNTADRSLAIIDYALRRRFSFFEMEPGFNSEGFTNYQNAFGNETFNVLIGQIKLLNKYTLHSNNVYQIFTYVKNQDKDNTGNVAGILLYAKTDEEITLDVMFNMGGNQIGAKILDLNKEIPLIAVQMDKLAKNFFKVKAAWRYYRRR